MNVLLKELKEYIESIIITENMGSKRDWFSTLISRETVRLLLSNSLGHAYYTKNKSSTKMARVNDIFKNQDLQYIVFTITTDEVEQLMKQLGVNGVWISITIQSGTRGIATGAEWNTIRKIIRVNIEFPRSMNDISEIKSKMHQFIPAIKSGVVHELIHTAQDTREKRYIDPREAGEITDSGTVFNQRTSDIVMYYLSKQEIEAHAVDIVRYIKSKDTSLLDAFDKTFKDIKRSIIDNYIVNDMNVVDSFAQHVITQYRLEIQKRYPNIDINRKQR